MYRLEGVEVRLQETAEAFEQTRLLARRTKAEFEKVKKQRYVYTYDCLHKTQPILWLRTSQLKVTTIFARSDAAATIYFIS